MTKAEYYLKIAEAVSQKSTCTRKKYGAIIVKNDEVIATGYNGAPRGCPNCSDKDQCARALVGAKHAHGYDLCMSVHAEMNAMLAARRQDMIGADMYIVGINTDDGEYAPPNPCSMCHRMIINAGIARVFGMVGSKDESTVAELDVSTTKFVKDALQNYDDVMVEMDLDQVGAMMTALRPYYEFVHNHKSENNN